MSKKELKDINDLLDKQRDQVKSSKKAAKKLLVGLGILTPKGNFTKDFR